MKTTIRGLDININLCTFLPFKGQILPFATVYQPLTLLYFIEAFLINRKFA